MNNSESESELPNKENGTEGNKNEMENKSKSLSIRERIIRFRKFITIEPLLVIYCITSAISNTAQQKFITERGCIVDLNFTEDICSKIVKGYNDNSTLATKDLVSTTIGNLNTWKLPLERFFPAILVLNIGAWSDRTGNRKTLMMVSLIGQVLYIAVYLAGLFFPTVPAWIISLAESLINTFSGGMSIFLTGIYCYVADTTEPEMRTIKMGVMNIVITLCGITGELIGGPLTKSTGYTIPIVISLVCGIFGVLFVYFKIHDVNRKKEEGSVCNKIVNFIHPKNFWESFSLLALSKGTKFVRILMVLFAYNIYSGPLALIFTLYNYLLDRYHMNEVDYTRFDATSQTINFLGTVIAMKLFMDMLKLHDCLLGIICTLSRFAGLFIYAFAPDLTWLYIGAVADIFGNVGMIVIRSVSTKIVDSEDVGKLLSILSFSDSIVGLAMNPLYTQVWVQYKHYFKGVSYLFGSIMTTPNFFIMFGLYYIDRKLRRDIVADPKAKEKHVYDNEMTSL